MSAVKLNTTLGSVTLVGEDSAGSATVTIPKAGVGKVLQVHTFEDNVNAVGTIAVPRDDTIPQITEGAEFMSTVFTPKSANSVLQIDVKCFIAPSGVNWIVTSLFRDDDVNALSSTAEYLAANTAVGHQTVRAFVALGNLTPRTFSVRAGGAGSETISFNGTLGVRDYGGALVSSITITEIGA